MFLNHRTARISDEGRNTTKGVQFAIEFLRIDMERHISVRFSLDSAISRISAKRPTEKPHSLTFQPDVRKTSRINSAGNHLTRFYEPELQFTALIHHVCIRYPMQERSSADVLRPDGFCSMKSGTSSSPISTTSNTQHR
jgi:hypothetical protein